MNQHLRNRENKQVRRKEIVTKKKLGDRMKGLWKRENERWSKQTWNSPKLYDRTSLPTLVSPLSAAEKRLLNQDPSPMYVLDRHRRDTFLNKKRCRFKIKTLSKLKVKKVVFYGQEPPSGESTTTECGFNYQLLAVIYWSSPMGSSWLQSTTTSYGQWRQKTVDPIDWSHPPPYTW